MSRGLIGLAMGVCFLASTTFAQESKELEQPVRLKAGDALIDTGEHIAHAGPLFGDYDGDGLPDLLVGNFRGHIQVYKNVGSRKAPKFKDMGLLKAGGETVKVKNW